MNDAYNFVREKRSIIGPNLVFMSQLSDFEDRLFKTNKPIRSSTSSTCISDLIKSSTDLTPNTDTIKQFAASTLTCIFNNPIFSPK
jgi:hypothetical protein